MSLLPSALPTSSLAAPESTSGSDDVFSLRGHRTREIRARLALSALAEQWSGSRWWEAHVRLPAAGAEGLHLLLALRARHGGRPARAPGAQRNVWYRVLALDVAWAVAIAGRDLGSRRRVSQGAQHTSTQPHGRRCSHCAACRLHALRRRFPPRRPPTSLGRRSRVAPTCRPPARNGRPTRLRQSAAKSRPSSTVRFRVTCRSVRRPS